MDRKKGLINVSSKKELKRYMSDYGTHVNVRFGYYWALRNYYEGCYHLVTYKDNHKPNTWNGSVESEIEVDLEEAYDFITKTRRNEKLNKILL